MLVEVREVPGGRGDFERGERRNYAHRFIARSNNPFDRPLSILRDPLLRARGLVLGQPDPFDRTCAIVGTHAQRREQTTKIWDLTVTSSNELEALDESPLTQPARFSVVSDQYVKQVTKDGRGRTITNSAGTIIPVPKDDSRWVIRVEKNLRSVPSIMWGLNNKLNRGTFFFRGEILRRHTVQCKGMRTADAQAIINGVRFTYQQFAYELHYRREGWEETFTNADLYERGFLTRWKTIRGSGGRRLAFDADGLVIQEQVPNGRKPILRNGEKVASEWPLDRQGRALPEEYIPADVSYTTVQPYEDAPFDLLPR